MNKPSRIFTYTVERRVRELCEVEIVSETPPTRKEILGKAYDPYSVVVTKETVRPKE